MHADAQPEIDSARSTPDVISRSVEHRFLLQCETVSPLTHGAGASSSLTDQPLRRTAAGETIVGGTAVAGVLRGLVQKMSCKPCVLDRPQLPTRSESRPPCGCPVCHLFGDAIPSDTAADVVDRPPAPARASASRVWVYDVRPDPRHDVRIVDSVAIDRRRRAAADSCKFDREEIAPGARLWLDVRGEGLSDVERDWVAAALKMLATGEVGLGGGAASGSGRLTCLSAAIYRRDLRHADHLRQALLHDGHALPTTAGDALPAWPEITRSSLDRFPASPVSSTAWSAQFELSPDLRWGGTFLVADPVASVVTGWDRAPRGTDAAKFAVELPARSVRGALRSGAERILATLADGPRQPATERLIESLFGSTSRSSRLRISVDPSPSRSPPTPSPWDHVAIDRFTGGATDAKKFDALVARGGSFTLRLSLVDVAAADLPWMKGLLALALRDLHDGFITVGHGASKGHGRFTLRSLDLSDGTDRGDAEQRDAEQRDAEQRDAERARPWHEQLGHAEDIQEWIDALHEKIERLKSPLDTPSGDPSDSRESGPHEPAQTIDERQPQATRPADALRSTLAELATPRREWSIRSARLTTESLVTVAQQLAASAPPCTGPMPLVYCESATRCGLSPWTAWANEGLATLDDAWHWRLFGNDLELTARRLTFGAESTWAVRLVAPHDTPLPPTIMRHWSQPDAADVALREEPSEVAVRLMGSQRGLDSTGDFVKTRVAAAAPFMRYPGDWPADARVALRVRRFSMSGGDIVCWVGLKQADDRGAPIR